MLEKFKSSLEQATIVRMGAYEYFVHPLTDGIPRMDPDLLEEVVGEIASSIELGCDVIVAPEAMGIPIAVGVSLRTRKPYNLVRKRKYSLPGEIAIGQVTGYSNSQMFMNGIREGDKVVILDDVLSTGGTLTSIVQAIRDSGAVVLDVLVVVEKGDHKKEIEQKLGIKIKTLVKVEVRDGRLSVIS